MIRVGSPEDHGLALAAIQIDGGTQSRATLNDHVVNDYAEAIKAGATFPPIVVFYDGKKHWLADGFHRFHAYQKIGREKVAADIRQGTRRDAILHSVGANETHGLRRTRDDKRRAVLTLLNDAEWGKWTDREIGRACQVHHETVGKLRSVTGETASERTYTTKHGTTATMKTAGINAGRTPFQAKASEDNGSITGGAGAVTGEASRLASGRTDAGEAASVDLPTIPRNIVAEVRELWNLATPSEREEIRAIINSSGSAARGQAAMSGECPVAPSMDEAQSQVTSDQHVEANAKGPSRTAAPISPSTAPTVEPEATPSPPPASGTHSNPQPVSLTTADKAEASTSSPSASAAIHRPATLAVADGQPSIPTDDARGAGRGAAVPFDSPQSTGAVTQFLNPICQKPDTCKWARSQASCAVCANAATKARAAA
jgi:hypothetical protein